MDTTANVARGFWDFWTPLRIVGLMIVLMMAGIGLWSLHARRLERAEAALNPAIEEGLAALERGDIGPAAARLSVAVDAMNLIGQHDRYSASVRQAYREARALDNLSSEPLLTILEQADDVVEKAVRSRRRAKPSGNNDGDEPPPLDADWINKFAALYEGGWVVMEAPVRRLSPTEKEPRRFVVEFPIGIGSSQHAVELRADFEVFEQLNVDKKAQSVIFGGQLQSMRFDEPRGIWKVRLSLESGFLWTGAATYRRLGFRYSEWHPQEAVEAQLARQAQALQVDVLIEGPSPSTPSLPVETP
ncbi:MAG: hypothetical protein ACK5Q5_06165 [Planctomycetaceae bacterium]